MKPYSNAPITEALIDIKVSVPSKVSLADLEGLHKKIEKEYPTKQKRRIWQGRLELSETSTTSKPTSIGDGYRFDSKDNRQVIQCRMDGFTFSRLKPYTKWDEMYDECMRLWEIYKNHIKPIQITRIAVRYINLIEIPSKKIDLEDYFKAYPKAPEIKDCLVTHFLSQVNLQFPEHDINAIVTLTPSPTGNHDCSNFVFDIDVFKEVAFEADNSSLSDILESLRNLKNDVFVKSITKKTEELFK